MISKAKYVEETPNMNYIVHLGSDDLDFEKEFIASLKGEFSWQLGSYLYHIKQDEPRAAAEIVYKIKHKFIMLGMKKAFYFSEFYEEQLHMGDMTLDDDFKKILKTVNEFLKIV